MNQVKLNEVANLYLPFKAQTTDDKKVYTIVGLSLYECLYQIEEKNDWWNDTNFLPILRKVVNITDDEKKELWKLIFKRDFSINGNILFRDDITYNSDKRWVLSSGVERLGIEINGTIWADSDLQNYKYNKHLVTNFLLKKGFDLFGLIESGQAVEATNNNEVAV